MIRRRVSDINICQNGLAPPLLAVGLSFSIFDFNIWQNIWKISKKNCQQIYSILQNCITPSPHACSWIFLSNIWLQYLLLGFSIFEYMTSISLIHIYWNPTRYHKLDIHVLSRKCDIRQKELRHKKLERKVEQEKKIVKWKLLRKGSVASQGEPKWKIRSGSLSQGDPKRPSRKTLSAAFKTFCQQN